MQHQVGDFAGRKGLSIHWQAWMPAACVLISHGLGEHGGRYDP
jgi:alpha-beta hydrolase superfamily lysophospholipase